MAQTSGYGIASAKGDANLRQRFLVAIGDAERSVLHSVISGSGNDLGSKLLLPSAMKIHYAGETYAFSERDFDAMRGTVG